MPEDGGAVGQEPGAGMDGGGGTGLGMGSASDPPREKTWDERKKNPPLRRWGDALRSLRGDGRGMGCRGWGMKKKKTHENKIIKTK